MSCYRHLTKYAHEVERKREEFSNENPGLWGNNREV